MTIYAIRASALALLYLVIATSPSYAETDRDDIKAVVASYLRVTDYQDQSAIARAFASDTVLTSLTSSGAIKRMTLAEWWARVSRIIDPKPRASDVEILDVEGVSAVVRVRFEKSCDHLLLLKTPDGWRIVSKALSVAL
jgi:hypothetical protein